MPKICLTIFNIVYFNAIYFRILRQHCDKERPSEDLLNELRSLNNEIHEISCNDSLRKELLEYATVDLERWSCLKTKVQYFREAFAPYRDSQYGILDDIEVYVASSHNDWKIICVFFSYTLKLVW